MFPKIAFPISACLLLATGIQAQEKESNLDPVTITATVNPVVSSKTGRNLYVIKGEEIAKMPVHSLDEVLRYLPGLEVQARGPMGAQSDLVLRGGTFQQVLVIVDGMRVNDPNTGHFNSYIPIVPAEIDRIEVLKGASSAIYGSDAVGGVIHIITKTFAQTGAPSQKVSAGVTGGAYGLFTANASGFYSTDKLAVSVGGLTNNADGQPQRGIDGYFHLHTLSGSVSYKLAQHWKLAYRLSYDIRKFAAQNFYTTALQDTAEEKVNTWWQQLALNYQKAGDHFQVQGGYKTVNDNYRYNPISVANDSRSKLWQGLATYEHAFNTSISLVSGVQYQQKSIASNDRGHHTVNQAAGFLALNTHIGDYLSVSPGARLDWDERSGYELIPQLNVSYRRSVYQLRASAGKTIRNADFTERYNNYGQALVRNGQRVGNPDLTAERSFSYEAGADFFAGKSFKIATTLFQRRYNDLIDWAITPYADMPRKDNLAPTSTYALARNLSKVVTSGVETDIQWLQTYANKHTVSATTGLIWLNSSTNEGIASFYTSSHAKFMANGMLRYSQPLFSISLNGLYKTREAQTAVAGLKGAVSNQYFIASIKAEVFVIKNKLGVYAEADNVFDKSYADLLGAQMPGRWLMGGIRFSY